MSHIVACVACTYYSGVVMLYSPTRRVQDIRRVWENPHKGFLVLVPSFLHTLATVVQHHTYDAAARGSPSETVQLTYLGHWQAGGRRWCFKLTWW